jgi:Cysteine-rich secretory protein family
MLTAIYSLFFYFFLWKIMENVGHFTQVVWKSSKELGVGKAKSRSGRIYVVANYYPPGNYQGQFAQNVLPPQQ